MRPILLLLPFTLASACTAAKIDANNPLTLRVGPDGGSVVSDGLKIDVPAGAVDSKITLTAYPKDRVIDGVTTASQIWSFGPDGQTFNAPITVSFAYDGQHDAATVWWTKEGDLSTFSNLKTTKADGWAAANVVHFSEGAVGDDTCGSGSSDEEDGVDCVDGINAATGEECDGGPSANQDDGEEGNDEGDAEEEDGGDEGDGVDCEDGINTATGEECDGGPSANQDGEEGDDEGDAEEEHGSCERDESEANDDGDDGEDEDDGEDTDNVEE